MVVKLCLLALFCLLMASCNSKIADLDPIASKPDFIRQLGAVTKLNGFDNTGFDNCTGVAVDRFDNIYCAGRTNSAMARSKTVDTSFDAFVAKFNRNGEIIWINQFGSENNGTDSCSSIALDTFGNIYCGGATNSKIGFNKGTILNKDSPTTFEPRADGATDSDAFIAKLDTNGTIHWIKQFGTKNWHESCRDIEVSKNNFVYCAGSTSGQLGTSPVNGLWEWQSGNQDDLMIGKWNSDGDEIWLRQISSRTQAYLVANVFPSSNYGSTDVCFGIAVDSNENVYCAGATESSLVENNLNSRNDVVLVKLNSDGFLQYIKQLGANSTGLYPSILLNVDNHEFCNDVIADNENNIYCSGETAVGMSESTPDAGSDGMVIKWNSDGILQWITQMGTNTFIPGYNNEGNQTFSGITQTPNGDIYVLGRTDEKTAGPNAGLFDNTIFGFDSVTGSLKYGYQFGSSANETCSGLVSDVYGNLYGACATQGSLGETNAGASNDVLIFRKKVP